MNELIQKLTHIYKDEFSRMTNICICHSAIITKEIAEDIVSEAFEIALNKCIEVKPKHIKAWLYKIVQNRTIDYLKKEKVKYIDKDQLININNAEIKIDRDITYNIDLLPEIFKICATNLSKRNKIAYCLTVYFNFDPEQVANALVSNKLAVIKRLKRTSKQLKGRLPVNTNVCNGQNMFDIVIELLYLVFNEGYHSQSFERITNWNYCYQAINLVNQLFNYSGFDTHKLFAVKALFYFQSSRINTKVGLNNKLVLFPDQNKHEWNKEYINLGIKYLYKAIENKSVSKYHLEAAIAYWHTTESEDKWNKILQLYNQLIEISNTPAIQISRFFVLSKIYGEEYVLSKIENILVPDTPHHSFYLATLYNSYDKKIANQYFTKAKKLCTNTNQLNQLSKIMQVKFGIHH